MSLSCPGPRSLAPMETGLAYPHLRGRQLFSHHGEGGNPWGWGPTASQSLPAASAPHPTARGGETRWSKRTRGLWRLGPVTPSAPGAHPGILPGTVQAFGMATHLGTRFISLSRPVHPMRVLSWTLTAGSVSEVTYQVHKVLDSLGEES